MKQGSAGINTPKYVGYILKILNMVSIMLVILTSDYLPDQLPVVRIPNTDPQ